jgi:hypothetical protein
MSELIAERLTMTPSQHYTSWAMQWGIDHEDEAAEVYETAAGNTVSTVGFILHPSIAFTGASPDRFVGESGGLEIKCPETGKHLETLETGEIDIEYYYQCMWGMVCTGRKWWDFASYDPRFKNSLCLFVKRIDFNPSLASEMEDEARKFLSDMDKKIERILLRFPSVEKQYRENWG